MSDDLTLTADEAHTIAGAYFTGNPELLDLAEPIIRRLAEAADSSASEQSDSCEGDV